MDVLKISHRLRLKIAAKLLIGFIIVVAAFIITDWYMIESVRSYLQDQVQTALYEKAELAAQEAEDVFAEFIQVGEELVSLYSYPFDDIDRDRASQTALLILQHTQEMREIAFLRPSGKEILRVDETGIIALQDLSFEITGEAFKEAQNGQIAISKTFSLPSVRGLVTNVYVPVKRENDVEGIIKLQVRLDALWEILSRVRRGKTGFAYIVDQDGRVVAHRNMQLVNAHTLFGDRRIIDLSFSSGESLQWPSDYRYINEDKTEVVSHKAFIKTAGWLAVFEQSEDEVYSYTSFIQRFFIVSYSITAFVLIGIAFALSANLVRSIQELIRGAQEFEKENLKERIQLTSGDEFEDLAVILNKMADKLDRSFTALAKQKEHSEEIAQMLLTRESDLREANEEMEHERNMIFAERNKFMMVLSGITDAVVSLDQSHRIVTFNAAAQELSGREAIEVIGKPLSEAFTLYNKAQEVHLEHYFTSDHEYGIIYQANYLKLVGRKKESFVDVVVGKIRGGERINLGEIITIHDLTQEQRLEEMKLDFVSMAAHELRTPLTSVQGYLSLYMDEYLKEQPEEARKLLKRVDISAKQLNELIESLLSVTRIEKGVFLIKPVPCRIGDLVSAVVADFQTYAVEKHITLGMVRAIDSAAEIEADEARIREVLVNLVGNAITYTPEGGEVSVRLEDRGETVHIEVADTGEGIPPDALDRLFTKFFRGTTTLAQASKGTGLGLYISKAIVTLHKGTISVESQQGKGSIFTVVLPKHQK